MKSTKIILVILLFAVSIEAFSNPVDIETARIVAQNFMSKSRNTSKMISDVVTKRFEGHNSFYVVNFREGGWVMVSAENSTVPVLAFSFDGTYRTEDEKPDGFLYLIEDYKEQVDVSRKMQSTRRSEVIEMWNQLMVDEKSGNDISRQSITSETKTYTPGRVLLNVPGRGEVAWGQSWNNDGDCTPSYNGKIDKKWWHGWFASCSDDCDKPPAGCGAVAMGQLMWYWQWPKSSSYRTYNWNQMPFELVNTSTSAQGDAIGNLLLDCGRASSMTYACNGSFTTSIGTALRDEFNYKATRAVYKSDWQSNSNVWNDLIRTEIDCERPVIMYGEKALTLDKKHYFIVDGYHATTPNYFHINFGWHGSYTGNYYYLNNITPGSHNFNSGQHAYIGISPTYPYPSNVNITDVSYTSVTGSKTEEAQQNISLPASGKNLSVESGGNLTLVAGKSITLKPGFHAKAGNNFTARIEPTYVNGSMEITELYVGWYHNDLWMYVENANSYDVTIENSSGVVVYQKAGVIFGSNYVDLWDGTSAPSDAYICRLRIRNNYGRSGNYLVSNLVVGSPLGQSGISNDSVNIDYRKFSLPVINEDLENVFSKEADVVIIYPQENAPLVNNVSENFFFTKSDVVVYPNPSSGMVHIDITKLFAYYNLKIYNITGILVYESRSIVQPTYSFDMSAFVDGAYTIRLEIDNQVIIKKLILAK
jgi:hypothetical protein